MTDSDCAWYEVGCRAGEAIGDVIGDAIQDLANSIFEAFGEAAASLGTMWVNIGTPNLTGTGGTSLVEPGEAAPDAENLEQILSYVSWVGGVVAILSLAGIGALLAVRARSGGGIAAAGRLGVVLAATTLLGGGSAMISAVLPAGPTGAAGAVEFLQASLWRYMAIGALAGVLIGAVRMAWEQRAEPGKDTLKGVLTLVVVAGAGVTVVSLLVETADSFSSWILERAVECDIGTDAPCFGENLMLLFGAGGVASGGLAPILMIVAGLFAILASLVQILLMVIRGGLLVVLTGVLPLAASFTNTEMGRTWFRKCVAWLIAFILYKPAAAIVYAAAFQLVGTDVFEDDGTGLLAMATGLALMLISLVALPALLRFVTPMVGAMAGGAAGGAAGAMAMSALPTGAAAIGRLGGGGGGAQATPTATGATSAGGGGGGDTQGPGGASAAAGGSGASGPSGTQGVSGSAGTGGSAQQPMPVGAGAGAQGGGAAAGAGAGGGAAAGAGAGAAAAGGPAGAAASVAAKGAQAMKQGTESSVGEGSDPDGSR